MSIDKVQEKIEETLSIDWSFKSVYGKPDKVHIEGYPKGGHHISYKDFIEKISTLISQAEARGREERDKYWLKRMNEFEKINKSPKDKIVGWSWLKTQLSDLLTKMGGKV